MKIEVRNETEHSAGSPTKDRFNCLIKISNSSKKCSDTKERERMYVRALCVCVCVDTSCSLFLLRSSCSQPAKKLDAYMYTRICLSLSSTSHKIRCHLATRTDQKSVIKIQKFRTVTAIRQKVRVVSSFR
jgi:hypothetical protein